MGDDLKKYKDIIFLIITGIATVIFILVLSNILRSNPDIVLFDVISSATARIDDRSRPEGDTFVFGINKGVDNGEKITLYVPDSGDVIYENAESIKEELLQDGYEVNIISQTSLMIKSRIQSEKFDAFLIPADLTEVMKLEYCDCIKINIGENNISDYYNDISETVSKYKNDI